MLFKLARTLKLNAIQNYQEKSQRFFTFTRINLKRRVNVSKSRGSMSSEESIFLHVHEDQCQVKMQCFFVFTRINIKRRVNISSCSRGSISRGDCNVSKSRGSIAREDCKFLHTHEDQYQEKIAMFLRVHEDQLQVKMQCFFMSTRINVKRRLQCFFMFTRISVK